MIDEKFHETEAMYYCLDIQKLISIKYYGWYVC